MALEWSVPFIGRKNELKTIESHLQAWGTRRIIFIWGEGGIGKTRLLHEVEQHFFATDRVKTLGIIDFDDDYYKFPQNVSVSIGRQLDPIAFDPYFEALRKIHKLEGTGSETEEVPIPVRRQILAINRLLTECFNHVSQHQRIVLRVDTTDALNGPMLLNYLYEIVSQFSNVLTLIAGRDTKQWYEKFRENMDEESVAMPVQPFTLDDSQIYLEQKQKILKVTLDKEWVHKLFILAGGLPVLIDLAIEWAQSHRSLPWMDKLSLSELTLLQEKQHTNDIPQQLNDLQERFRKTLVTPIADLYYPLDRLKLVLSKVYPLDLEGLMEMLDLGQHDASRLLDQALQSVTIKKLPDGRIKLHDEVQHLINRHVWSFLDKDQKWELRDSRRAITYLTRKSDVLLDEIRELKRREGEQIDSFDPSLVLKIFGERREKEGMFWSLRIERLRRQLAINVQQGYELFEQDYQLSREEASSLSYRHGLLEVMSRYADLDSPGRDIQGEALQEEQKLAILRRLARQATLDGRYKTAAELFEQLRRRTPKDTEGYIEIMNGQAKQLVRAGRLQGALQLNEQALSLSEQLNSRSWIIRSTLEIGLVHRLIGNLEQALLWYHKAFEASLTYRDGEQIAQIYTNMSYVHALQRENRAFDEIQQAIRQWKKLIQTGEVRRFLLGQCYHVAGEVYLAMERPRESLSYFELAWNIFNQEEVENLKQETPVAEWRSKCRSGRGFTYWQLAVAAQRRNEHEAATQHVQDARRDLTWAAEHATEFDSPMILYRLGEVFFLLKDYHAAEKNWIESMKEAQQVGDARTVLHSLSKLAHLSFYHPVENFQGWRDFDRWYRHKYRQQFQTYFELLTGLFYTYLGHLTFKAEDIKNTVTHYNRGLPLLTQSGIHNPFNLIYQLDFIEREIFPLVSSECIQQVGELLQEPKHAGTYDMIALAYFKEWSGWKEA